MFDLSYRINPSGSYVSQDAISVSLGNILASNLLPQERWEEAKSFCSDTLSPPLAPTDNRCPTAVVKR